MKQFYQKLIIICLLISSFIFLCGIYACEKSNLEDGPWVGNWILINSLGEDDNGVWNDDYEDTSGIGICLVVTPQKWIEKGEYSGCESEYSHSIFKLANEYRYSLNFETSSCGGPSLDDSGRLEFSDNNNIMFQYFDYAPGDTLYAFKWMRQSAP